MTPRKPGTVETLAALANLFEFDLVAHRLDGAQVRADEDDALVGQRLGESGAFGEKAVAGMHRLGAGLLAGGDDLLDDEIGLDGRRRPDRDRLAGHFDVQRVLVGLGIDGDRLYAHAARGLDDPTRDLAAIGDQDFLEHCPLGGRPLGPGPCRSGGSIGARAARKQRRGPRLLTKGTTARSRPSAPPRPPASHARRARARPRGTRRARGGPRRGRRRAPPAH